MFQVQGPRKARVLQRSRCTKPRHCCEVCIGCMTCVCSYCHIRIVHPLHTRHTETTYSLHVQHIQQTSQDEAILSLFLLDYIYDFVVSFVDASSYFLSTFSYVFRALERVFLVKVFRPFPFFHLFPLLQV